MKKWITERPYFFTSIIFLIIMIFGWRVLHWQEDNFAFLLLLYFIVTLGIRLDDISRKMGVIKGKPSSGAVEKESIIGQLNDIKRSITTLNATISKLAKEIDKEEH